MSYSKIICSYGCINYLVEYLSIISIDNVDITFGELLSMLSLLSIGKVNGDKSPIEY